MKTRAIQKNVPISSQKANLVCALIRNKPVNQALVILEHTEKKTSAILKKLLQSAIANATNNHHMIGEKLYVYEVRANQGSTIKRSLPRAKGSANMIRKRHSHLEIILSDDPKQREKDLKGIKEVNKTKSHMDPKIKSKSKTEVKKVIKKLNPKENIKLEKQEGGNQ